MQKIPKQKPESLTPEQTANILTAQALELALAQGQSLDELSKPNKYHNDASHCPTITANIHFFINLTDYIVEDILLADNVKESSQRLEYWISVSHHALTKHDYFTANAIYAALNSSSMHCFKIIWSLLDSRASHLFKTLKNSDALTSRSPKQFRLCKTMFNDGKPVIPFLATTLRTISFFKSSSNSPFEPIREIYQLTKKFIVEKNDITSSLINDILNYEKKLTDDARYIEAKKRQKKSNLLIPENSSFAVRITELDGLENIAYQLDFSACIFLDLKDEQGSPDEGLITQAMLLLIHTATRTKQFTFIINEYAYYFFDAAADDDDDDDDEYTVFLNNELREKHCQTVAEAAFNEEQNIGIRSIKILAYEKTTRMRYMYKRLPIKALLEFNDYQQKLNGATERFFKASEEKVGKLPQQLKTLCKTISIGPHFERFNYAEKINAIPSLAALCAHTLSQNPEQLNPENKAPDIKSSAAILPKGN